MAHAQKCHLFILGGYRQKATPALHNPDKRRISSAQPQHHMLLIFQNEGKFRWLKPGFRHCFTAWQIQEAPQICLILNPLCRQCDIRFHPGSLDMLALYYRRLGMRVRNIARRNNIGKWRPELRSCVSLTKYLAGIDQPLIFTPWQLYRYVTKAHPTPSRQKDSNMSGITSPALPQTRPAVIYTPENPAKTAKIAPVNIPSHSPQKSGFNLLSSSARRSQTLRTTWQGIPAQKLSPRNTTATQMQGALTLGGS